MEWYTTTFPLNKLATGYEIRMFLRIIVCLGLLSTILGCSEDNETTGAIVEITTETTAVAMVAGNNLSSSSEMATFHMVQQAGTCGESMVEKSTYEAVMSFGAGIQGHCPKISPEGWSLEWGCRQVADENGERVTMFSYRIPNTSDMLEYSKQNCLSQEGSEWLVFD